jgi:cardiolipin-specific phospholipase
VPLPPTEEEQAEKAKHMSMGGRFARSIVRSMWDAGTTPQSVSRTLSWVGLDRWMVNTYTSRRMGSVNDGADIQKSFNDYLHMSWAAPACGEAAMNVILSPGAWARKPLMKRLPLITAPTVFIYGSHDWMDPTAARTAVPTMLLSPEKEVLILEGAGHQMFVDNPEGFSDCVSRACHL